VRHANLELGFRDICVALAGLAAGGFIAGTAPAVAHDRDAPPVGRFEAWVGGDYLNAYWSAWAGVTAAPFGAFADQGWRVRAVAGGGRSSSDVPVPQFTSGDMSLYDGRNFFAEASIGYQIQLGMVTLKAFAGILHQDRIRLPFLSDRAEVARTGAKVAVESWWSLSEKMWATADASFTTIDALGWGRLRAGYRILGDLSLGAEAAVIHADRYTEVRAGMLLRYGWQRGEMTLAGGFSQATGGDGRTPYVTTGLLLKY
jgi:hypothetical protein